MKPQDIAKSGTESGHQRAFFAWLAVARLHGFSVAYDWVTWDDWRAPIPVGEPRYPELELFHAIPNGGKRDKITAANLKAEGTKAGVLDTFLPVPKHTGVGDQWWHGLYIEFKRPDRKNHKNGGMSDAQVRFADLAGDQGYYCASVYTWQEAANILMYYYGVDTRYDMP